MLSEYCRKWIRYAENDIDIAAREISLPVNPRHRAYEAILYHCQQSAEKMLKAYLISKGSNPWGHDLDALRTQCAVFDKDFDRVRLVRHCVFLTTFVAARYPDFTFTIDSTHAIRGLNSAKRIYEFISEKLAHGRKHNIRDDKL